jgi:hypothetical protein
VETLPCGHVALEGGRLCRHLLGERADELDTYRVLRGAGVEYALCCLDCAKAGEPPDLITGCEGCFSRVDDPLLVTGVIGEPEIRRRLEPVSGVLTEVALPAAPLDLAPVGGCAEQWLLLTDRELLRWHSGTGEISSRVEVNLPGKGPERAGGKAARYRVHSSAGGEFAVVAVDYGERGLVVDLASGRVTMKLDRGRYQAEQTEFPAAFLNLDGRPVLVHATKWNRVDLSDPATGVLLTPREFEVTGKYPAHFLDYFFGALHPSPGGRLIASDGWVWHPVGMPRVWDARQWRFDYVYEPEDGLSARTVRHVAYYWDKPMCWLDDSTLVLAGVGADDEAMIPGAEIYDVNSAVKITAFAGPAGPLFCDRDQLYSASPGGLEVWDIGSGVNTGVVPGFVPSRFHPASRQFAAISGDTMRTWRFSPSATARPAGGAGMTEAR